jgi:cysteinyl-tRNA synthetase
MSCALLGQHFDIHGGGADLQFPHHENEIAQTEGALYGQGKSDSDTPWVNYWMHNGHIRVNQEKMSKSLGNFFLIRDVLTQYDPEVIRFFMLRAHYRSPINYSDVQIDESRSGLVRLYTALAQANAITVSASQNAALTAPWVQRFNAAMDDDFNTPDAIAVLFDLASELNRKHASGELDVVRALAEVMQDLAGVLGFLERDPAAFLQSGSLGELDAATIEQQIAARVAAKQAKAFEKADAIRAELLKQGVVLEDKPGGVTEWRRA